MAVHELLIILYWIGFRVLASLENFMELEDV